MVYMYVVKHKYVSWWYVYYTKAQLHVSAINVGHENLSIGYTNVCREFNGGGGCRCEILILFASE